MDLILRLFGTLQNFNDNKGAFYKYFFIGPNIIIEVLHVQCSLYILHISYLARDIQWNCWIFYLTKVYFSIIFVTVTEDCWKKIHRYHFLGRIKMFFAIHISHWYLKISIKFLPQWPWKTTNQILFQLIYLWIKTTSINLLNIESKYS